MRPRIHRLTAALLILALLGVLGPPTLAAPGDGANPDETFIVVHKTFAGITDTAKIDSDFTIILSNADVTHTLTSENRDLTGNETDVQGNVVWQWKVYTPAGKYDVSETNTDILGYSLIRSEGLGTVETLDSIKDITFDTTTLPSTSGNQEWIDIPLPMENGKIAPDAIIYVQFNGGKG